MPHERLRFDFEVVRTRTDRAEEMLVQWAHEDACASVRKAAAARSAEVVTPTVRVDEVNRVPWARTYSISCECWVPTA